MLIVARFCNLILPDWLGCTCFLTLPIPSLDGRHFFAIFLTKPSWLRSKLYLLPPPHKFRHSAHNRGSLPLFILHLKLFLLNFNWSLRTKGRMQNLQVLFVDSFCSLFTLHEGRTAWVQNCILATHWACSTRTWHDSCRVFFGYRANVPQEKALPAGWIFTVPWS